ncbi:MAG: alkaline phosphatase family protein, partial [Nocardioidaceae bacterium]
MSSRSLRRWSPLAAGVAVAAAGLAFSAMVPADAGPGHHGNGHGHHAQSHRLSHVFIIMLENHSKGDVVGDPDMPYTTHLAHRYAQATNYYGVTHPSEPNYIAATSGSTWDTNDDDGWNSGDDYPRDTDTGGNHYPHRNIVDQLEANHIRWAAYMESMPEAGYLPDDWPEEDTGLDPLYESKHNPFILYNDIRSDPQRRSRIRPYDQMAHDLDSRHAPRYVWITPNLCNDLHGGVGTKIPGYENTPCPYGDAINQDEPENQLQQNADEFVRQAVRTIKHS